jgi:hypothetical protein
MNDAEYIKQVEDDCAYARKGWREEKARRIEVEKELSQFVKLADDLTGKIGGPNTPPDPAWEDEFAALDIAVGEYQERQKECKEDHK